MKSSDVELDFIVPVKSATTMRGVGGGGRQAGRNPRVMMEAEVKGRPEERGWKELGSGVPLGVF